MWIQPGAQYSCLRNCYISFIICGTFWDRGQAVAGAGAGALKKAGVGGGRRRPWEGGALVQMDSEGLNIPTLLDVYILSMILFAKLWSIW